MKRDKLFILMSAIVSFIMIMIGCLSLMKNDTLADEYETLIKKLESVTCNKESYELFLEELSVKIEQDLLVQNDGVELSNLLTPLASYLVQDSCMTLTVSDTVTVWGDFIGLSKAYYLNIQLVDNLNAEKKNFGLFLIIKQVHDDLGISYIQLTEDTE